MSRHLAQLLVVLALLAGAGPLRAGEVTEIEYLLDWVRVSGCTFVRNGDDHAPAAAADHLAMKYRRARRWVDSAEMFIERIASKSSMSGRAYTVRCADTGEQRAGDWLRGALADYRRGAVTD